jgi:hypothetical protein
MLVAYGIFLGRGWSVSCNEVNRERGYYIIPLVSDILSSGYKSRPKEGTKNLPF